MKDLAVSAKGFPRQWPAKPKDEPKADPGGATEA